FKCECSKEKARIALQTLGAVELQHLLDTDEKFIVNCEMCGKSRNFSPMEVENIIKKLLTEKK
ncbi:MAG: Hsp33 family molecular chaperone HslO, partial [bacterium]